MHISIHVIALHSACDVVLVKKELFRFVLQPLAQQMVEGQTTTSLLHILLPLLSSEYVANPVPPDVNLSSSAATPLLDDAYASTSPSLPSSIMSLSSIHFPTPLSAIMRLMDLTPMIESEKMASSILDMLVILGEVIQPHSDSFIFSPMWLSHLFAAVVNPEQSPFNGLKMANGIVTLKELRAYLINEKIVRVEDVDQAIDILTSLDGCIKVGMNSDSDCIQLRPDEATETHVWTPSRMVSG